MVGHNQQAGARWPQDLSISRVLDSSQPSWQSSGARGGECASYLSSVVCFRWPYKTVSEKLPSENEPMIKWKGTYLVGHGEKRLGHRDEVRGSSWSKESSELRRFIFVLDQSHTQQRPQAPDNSPQRPEKRMLCLLDNGPQQRCEHAGYLEVLSLESCPPQLPSCGPKTRCHQVGGPLEFSCPSQDPGIVMVQGVWDRSGGRPYLRLKS
jgi:hypothetical protein